MAAILTSFPVSTPNSWRDLVMPKEHGSWSLAFEPLVFGLLIAPSTAGGGLALAVAVAFFARRPLKIAARDQREARRAEARTAVLACAGAAAICMLVPLSLAGAGWLVWLLPSAVLGVVFLSFDLRNFGREEAAELAGSAVFALLPAAFIALSGGTVMSALAAAVVMLGRAVPTVCCVRALLRGSKTGEIKRVLPLSAAFAAFAAGCFLAREGYVPFAAVMLLGLLLLRAVVLLVLIPGCLCARTIGMIEAVNGVLFVLVAGLLWAP